MSTENAHTASETAIEALVAIAEDRNADAQARIAAACSILDDARWHEEFVERTTKAYS